MSTLRDQLETIDGLVLERFTAPVRDCVGHAAGPGRDPVRHHRPPPRAARGAGAGGGERRPARARRAAGAGGDRDRARGAHAGLGAHAHRHPRTAGRSRRSRWSARRAWRCSRSAAAATWRWARRRGFTGRRCAACAGGEARGCSHGSSTPAARSSCTDTHDDPGLDLPIDRAERDPLVRRGPDRARRPRLRRVDRQQRPSRTRSPSATCGCSASCARHASAAIQNALQFEQERQIAETLQDALLAEEPPEVDGLEMATLYRAAAGAMVGGDLYDIWVLPDGKVAVMVGDVAGKGVQAAGTTGMVRYLAGGPAGARAGPGPAAR